MAKSIFSITYYNSETITSGEVLQGFALFFRIFTEKEGTYVQKIVMAILSCALLIVKEIFDEDD